MTSGFPPLSPPTAETLSIAVTVYNRRDYILQSIASALEQTPTVRVIVVEDHSPDPGLRDLVLSRFGEKIRYISNPKRRGLFGNWNACLDACETEWISILHDDDYLLPGFVRTMLDFAAEAPVCGLYFCSQRLVDANGNPVPSPFPQVSSSGRKIDPCAYALRLDTLFPGQLLHVASAKALGAFRESSQYCGDWEMWHKLVCTCGARQTSSVLAVNRWHEDPIRGTTKVIRLGRKRALEFVQIKRNLHRLRSESTPALFDRTSLLASSPAALKEILPWAQGLSPRLLRYNAGLIVKSKPPSLGYALLRQSLRLFPPQVLRLWGALYTKALFRKVS
jgi:glycosyltransferase involved in cell wall biosynthesis